MGLRPRFSLELTLASVLLAAAVPSFASTRCKRLFRPVSHKAVPLFDLAKVKEIDFHPWGIVPHHVSGRSDPAAWPEVEKVVRFANHQFERRNWSESFREGRVKIAKEFLPQSEYAYTTDRLSGEITASIGMTVAKKDAGEILTMEKSHHWEIKPAEKKGPCSKVIELRTYGIDHSSGPDLDPHTSYAFLWKETNRMLQNEMKGCPELLKKGIIYTYGDETSIRMYGKMGFEVADPAVFPPVLDGDTRWQVLIATPEAVLRSFLDRMQVDRSITPDTELVRIRGSGGKEFIDKGMIHVNHQNEVNFQLAEESEVLPGIWARATTRVSLAKDGSPLSIYETSRPSKPIKGLFVDRGAYMSFYPNGTISAASRLAKPYSVPGSKIILKKGGSIHFNPDGHFYTGFPIESPAPLFPKEYPNLLVSPEGSMIFDTEEKTAWFNLEKSSKLPKGVFIPEDGFDLKATFVLKGNRPELRSIRCSVGHETTLPNGMSVPEGNDIIYNFENGDIIPSYEPTEEMAVG